jgi:hypothetical protein
VFGFTFGRLATPAFILLAALSAGCIGLGHGIAEWLLFDRKRPEVLVVLVVLVAVFGAVCLLGLSLLAVVLLAQITPDTAIDVVFVIVTFVLAQIGPDPAVDVILVIFSHGWLSHDWYGHDWLGCIAIWRAHQSKTDRRDRFVIGVVLGQFASFIEGNRRVDAARHPSKQRRTPLELRVFGAAFGQAHDVGTNRGVAHFGIVLEEPRAHIF